MNEAMQFLIDQFAKTGTDVTQSGFEFNMSLEHLAKLLQLYAESQKSSFKNRNS